MTRMCVAGSGLSSTGSMADHRRAVKPSQVAGILAAIAGKLGIGGAEADKESKEFIEKVGEDISKTRDGGKNVVFVAGSRQPAEVHAAVAAINAKLAAPVDYYAEAEDPRADAGWTGYNEQLKAFAAAAAGADAVVVIGANPVLTAPADLKIADTLKSKL